MGNRIDTAIQWTFRFLEDMPPGTQIQVRNVKASDKELLIECVKYYIDLHGGVRFSNDYSKIIKE